MSLSTSVNLHWEDGSIEQRWDRACFGHIGSMNIEDDKLGRLQKVEVLIPTEEGLRIVEKGWNNILGIDKSIQVMTLISQTFGVPLVDVIDRPDFTLAGSKRKATGLVYDVSKRWNKGIVRFCTFNRIAYEAGWNRQAYTLKKILDDPRCKKWHILHKFSVAFSTQVPNEGHSLILAGPEGWIGNIENPNMYIKRFYDANTSNNNLFSTYKSKKFNGKIIREYSFTSPTRSLVLPKDDIDKHYNELIDFYCKEFKHILK